MFLSAQNKHILSMIKNSLFKFVENYFNIKGPIQLSQFETPEVGLVQSK